MEKETSYLEPLFQFLCIGMRNTRCKVTAVYLSLLNDDLQLKTFSFRYPELVFFKKLA